MSALNPEKQPDNKHSKDHCLETGENRQRMRSGDAGYWEIARNVRGCQDFRAATDKTAGDRRCCFFLQNWPGLGKPE